MPSFSMHHIPALMRANRYNALTTYSPDGQRVERRYDDVYRATCAVVQLLTNQGCALGRDASVIVAGQPGYDWLLVALACFFTGTELVALPETFTDEEVRASLAGYPVHFAVLDQRFGGYASLAAIPSLPLAGIGARAEGLAGPELLRSERTQVVAFTSGSTAGAKVKMFRVNLESTAHFIGSFTKLFAIGRDDLWAVCHSFSHIVHLEYVLGGLALGYDVAIVDVLRLVIGGAELQPSVLVTVPSVYEQLANQIRRRLAATGVADDALDGMVAERWQRREAGERLDLLPQAAEVIGARLKMMLIGAAPSAASLKQFLLAAGLPVFEGYGMSETNMISCNTPEQHRFGTVGPMWPEIEARVNDEGVLCVRTGFERTRRYLNVSDAENASVFLPDGWVNTGDLAEIDDGFVRLVGRKKEVLISASGKNINVAAIEAQLREQRDIGHVMLFGDRRPYLVGMFAPLPDRPLPSEETLREAVARVNETLPLHERILQIIRLSTPFDAESGLLTRSGKPRRQLIEQRFSHLIEQCYV